MDSTLFYITLQVLLLGCRNSRLGRIWLGSLSTLLAFPLQLLQLPDSIVLQTQTMAVTNIDICPSSSISNCYSTRPNQIAKACYSIDEWSSLLFSDLVDRNGLSSDGNTPVGGKTKCFVRFIIIDTFESFNDGIFFSQLCIECFLLLLTQFRINVVWATSL